VAFNCFGQVKSDEVNGLKITNNEIRVEADTIINVIYKNNIETNNKPDSADLQSVPLIPRESFRVVQHKKINSNVIERKIDLQFIKNL
jgi:hypothetical protein